MPPRIHLSSASRTCSLKNMPIHNQISSIRPLARSELPTSPITKRILLLLDWDGSLTPLTTLSHISRIQSKGNAPLSPSENPLKKYTDAYIADYTAHKINPSPPVAQAGSHTSLDQELAYLDGLRPVEEASIKRLEEGGLWRGVITEDVTRAAREEQEVQLRKGARELIERVWGSGGVVAVVSVSWSATWVAGMLKAKNVDAEAVSNGSKISGVQDARKVMVFANEIAGDGSGKMSRGLPTDEEGLKWDGVGNGVWTAGDKLAVMRNLMEKLALQNNWTTVYAGDSSTDLGCLAEADTGVIIGDSNGGEQVKLRQVVDRLGWIVGDGNAKQDGTRKHENKQLLQCGDFFELSKRLFNN